MSNDALFSVKDLTKHFSVKKSGFFNNTKGEVKAVDGISLDIAQGETVGIVGESGCGKTTAGRTFLKLISPTSGQIFYKGEEITHFSPGQMRPLRAEMQIIFQDPYSALNPRQTIGKIISAPFEIQGVTPTGGVKGEVQRLMERVGLNPEHFNRYPHEFSGGQRQRIGIARAIALKPKFVVADEPVSALDVSIQAQVINLLDDLKREDDITIVFIAHDLSVVQHISDRVVVMYLGKVMEISDSNSLYSTPHHPYTKALLSAVPQADPRLEKTRERIILTGDLPSPMNPPSGCVFSTRCWKAQDICRSTAPALLQVGASTVACHFPE
jgi:oligopeptide/dipeptide ABC transporter ATP-binding protein